MQDAWHDHRRHAIQVVAALPESVDDALIVLDLARQLVEDFLRGDRRPLASVVEPTDGDRDRLRVVSLSSAIKGASF